MHYVLWYLFSEIKVWYLAQNRSWFGAANIFLKMTNQHFQYQIAVVHDDHYP